MYMDLFRPEERRFARAVQALAYENPFTSARVEHERTALGDAFSPIGVTWSAEDDLLPEPGAPERPNLAELQARSERLTDLCLTRFASRAEEPAHDDLLLYEDLALYALFARHESELYRLCLDEGPLAGKIRLYPRFAADFARWLEPEGRRLPSSLTAPFVFALFFQIRRAFHFVFRGIFGASPAVARLRANVWESVFTRDLKRYRAGLHRVLRDIPTLVTGETGTGKEIVARAVGLSRFVPFDPSTGRFAVAFRTEYFAVNLSALSPTLIESELFGHKRGAFTGALEDRRGFLEAAGEQGTVFLDEIGDLDGAIQVKLLRVLQARELFRVGETTPRAFLGKIVAATHRDLGSEMAAGRFREDLYYRLCADRIVTPTLRERLASDPDELPALVRVLTRRVAGAEGAPALESDVLGVVEKRLGRGYSWPGNVRELEQCVRSVLVRGTYEPLATRAGGDPSLDGALLSSGLSAEALVRRYAALVYERTGSFVLAGRKLGLDRRTVKEHVSPEAAPPRRERNARRPGRGSA